MLIHISSQWRTLPMEILLVIWNDGMAVCLHPSLVISVEISIVSVDSISTLAGYVHGVVKHYGQQAGGKGREERGFGYQQ